MDPDIPMALITSFNEWNEGTQIEPTREANVTSQDHSPTKTDYTQGYAYQGYGERYLSILQNTFMAVSGRVMDEKRERPLPQATLKVFQGENLRADVLTDSHGFYNVSRLNLPPGIYELRANFPGSHEIRTQIDVSEKKSITLNLRLIKE